MKTVGIFEAKTHFSRLCEEVVQTGAATLVERRGKPIVMITPVPAAWSGNRSDIITDLRAYDMEVGPAEEEETDFSEVWNQRRNRRVSPLDE